MGFVEGATETPIEGLTLFRISEPVERLPGVYAASVCALVQGSKRAYLGGIRHTYDEWHYLCCSMPLPIEAEVLKATTELPVMGILLSLDTPLVAETVIQSCWQHPRIAL